MPAGSNAKRERQYEHIKDSARSRGASSKRAKEIAARTVNKNRRLEGRTPNKTTQGTGNPNRALTNRPKAELYNRATGSFNALSAWTDGSNPADRALIDDAYSRMMSLMRELDLEPPRHDPDHNPLRR